MLRSAILARHFDMQEQWSRRREVEKGEGEGEGGGVREGLHKEEGRCIGEGGVVHGLFADAER